MLDQRPTDGVGVIAEDAGGLRAGWMERRQVIAQARRNGRPLHSIERDDVPPDHVRVVVSARDGEVAACRIPLSSVTFEPVRGIG
jgi:hypothetical protein